MLYINDILVSAESQHRARVIHLNFGDNQAWLYNLSAHNPLPKPVALDALVTAIQNHALFVEQNQQEPICLKPSTAAKEARTNTYNAIQPLVETTDILIPKLRNSLINQRAAELGTSPRTLINYLRLWWANGQCKDALLPEFHKRGSTQGDTSSRGRPPKYEDRPIYQLSAQDRERIKEVAKTHYLKGEVGTIAGAHAELHGKYFSRIDSEGNRILLPDGEFPSYAQFRRVVLSEFPRSVVLRKRKGDAEYELNHRPVLGSLYVETYTVGDIFEIDATIADVFLVSSKNRAKIVGKPTLYLIVDRKSWLIVGFYVGFENASWMAAMQAILSISEDKQVICQRYGIPYNPSDWPAHGVFPKEFVADRGEMLSQNSTSICEGLSSTVRNLPSKRADHKPFVECGFKLIHQPISQAVPGYEPPSNVTKRQGKHYEQDACLTLDEFTKVILLAIIRHNRSPRHVKRLSAEQVLDGNQLPIPIDVWNTEIRQRAGALSRVSESAVRFALLPESEANISREGIYFENCYYSCTEAMARGWHDIAARNPFRVPISFDRRLVDTIYIHDTQNPGEYLTATLLDKCRDFRGLSFAEVRAIEFFRKQLGYEAQRVTRQKNFEFNQVVKPLGKNALIEAKSAAKGKTRTARKADIVQDRQAELRSERQARGAATKQSVPLTQSGAEIIALPVTPANTNLLADSPDARRQKLLQEMMNGF